MSKYISLEGLGHFLSQLKSQFVATSSNYGGIKLGYTQSGKNYAVQLDGDGKAYVNVPWEKSEGGSIIINKTYAQLKTLITNNTLQPGTKYRITDYTTIVPSTTNIVTKLDGTTVDTDVNSAGHVFDIIVTAISTNKLSEDAKVCPHSGNNYFSNCNMGAWSIKYCVDNDTNRFAWASSSGKGVIYWMKDDLGNEAPYDFKNIRFASLDPLYKQTAESIGSSTLGTVWAYTFTLDSAVCVVEDGSVIDIGRKYFGNNIIKPLIVNGKQYLNNIQLYTGTSTDSTFDDGLGLSLSGKYWLSNTSLNIFGDNCYSCCIRNSNGNVIGNNSGNISIFNNVGNIIGNNCTNIKLDNYCYSSDKIVNEYHEISTGNNIIGNYCNQITGNLNCTNNTLGNDCATIVLADDCNWNVFGASCTNIETGENWGEMYLWMVLSILGLK